MKCVDLHQQFRIFYKTDRLATGQTVLFNIWDSDGNRVTTNLQGTEIGTDGVYYIDYAAPGVSDYLLIIGSNNGNLPLADVVRVGGPDEKAWYVNNKFRTGQTIPYDVYDSSGDTVVSGILTDVAGGFYYADVEGIPDPWFFEVYPGTKRPTECIPP